MELTVNEYDEMKATIAALRAELADWQRMRNEMRDVAFANKERAETAEAAHARAMEACGRMSVTIAKFDFEVCPRLEATIERLRCALEKVATQECIMAKVRLGGDCGLCVGCIARAALAQSAPADPEGGVKHG